MGVFIILDKRQLRLKRGVSGFEYISENNFGHC